MFNKFIDTLEISLIKLFNIIIPKGKRKLFKKGPLDFAPGDYLGKRYQIIKELSSGDMGKVYKALDKQLNIIIALRLINPELNNKGWMEIVQQLKEKKKEALAQGRGSAHKMVTKLYDIGNVGNIKFISMQYLEKESDSKISMFSKRLILSFSIALAVLVGLAIFFALGKREAEAPTIIEPAKKSIAVMYFENNTGDEGLDHWRKALSDLLIADLAQSQYLRVLSEKRLYNILNQLNQLEANEYPLDVLQQVAEKGKIGYVLVGSLSRAGNLFRISIKIQEAKTGELIGTEMVEGIGEDSIFSMVDDLTRRIKTDFKLRGDQIANDIDKEVGKITTCCPEAYKYYSQGLRYHALGDYHKSIQFMEKALAMDPEFAMAYRTMANAYYNMSYFAEEKKYLQKALALADRVSDRERYLIQADAFGSSQSEETWDKAIKAYEKLLHLYPDDLAGNNNLGIFYAEIEEWDKAIERFEILKQNKNEFFFLYTNLAHVYMSKGLYYKTERTLKHYLSNFSDNATVHRFLAYNYICQGKYNLALLEADKALSIEPDYYENIALKGEIYHLRGKLTEAEKQFLKLLDLEEKIAHLNTRSYLAYLYLSQGRIEEAEDQFKQGLKLSIELNRKVWEIYFHLSLAYLNLRFGNSGKALNNCDNAWRSAVEAGDLSYQKLTLYFKTLSYLESNSIDKAAKTAKQLQDQIEEGICKKKIRYHYHLIGMMALKRNNFLQAAEHFEKAISLLPSQKNGTSFHALFINSLATAYYQAGNLERAQKKYEKIKSLTMGRIEFGDIYAESYYMLGKIYQQKDWKGKAIENYEKFLNLWKDADHNIPHIIDAKKQLAALKA